MQSGLIYFKDWNSGTLTYRDPRQTSVPLGAQRIGQLSISLSPETSPSNATSNGAAKKLKPEEAPQRKRLPWTLSTDAGDSCATETTTTTTSLQSAADDDDDDDEHSLELSLNLPGTRAVAPLPAANSNQEESVCTMEKVRSALERSNWLLQSHGSSSLLPKKRSWGHNLQGANSSSNSPRLATPSSGAHSASRSTSQCSDSECFTSPSAMSYDGDDEEVQQQQRAAGRDASTSGVQAAIHSGANDLGLHASAIPSEEEVMVIVGCKSCLMYVMLSKAHPCCPKCGNADVLMQLPAPAPVPLKKQRLTVESSSPTWSWCTA